MQSLSGDLDAIETARRDGRLADAETQLRRLLETDPPFSAGLRRRLADVLAEQGAVEPALEALASARGREEPLGELLLHAGEILRRAGRAEEALEAYRRAEADMPGDPRAPGQIGVVEAARGRLEAAIAAFARAAEFGGGPKILNNYGTALEAAGRLAEAEAAYRRSLAADPSYAVAWHNLGSCLRAGGDLEGAAEAFEQALALRPELAQSWNFLGVVREEQGRSQDALAAFERAIQAQASFPDAWANRSASLRRLGRHEDARRSAEEALRLRPGSVDALNALGVALTELGRFEAAVEALSRARDGRPEDGKLHLNLGLAEEKRRAFGPARLAYEAAERLCPGSPDPVYALGSLDLREGRYASALRRLEVRWSQEGGPTLRHPRETLWLGDAPIAGRRLLVHAEQGFGDVIQHARFLRDVAAAGAETILECQGALVRLLGTLRPPVRVEAFTEVAEAPAFDLHIPIMSLPLALGTALEDVGRAGAYLEAPEEARRFWADRLERGGRPRVGLVWSGNPRHRNDAERSLAFRALSPLLELGADFVCLQAEIREGDRRELDLSGVRRFDLEIRDFADTAAIVETCDLVVAVDTAVAHLAGALGRPTLLMLGAVCDPRWMEDRADTPWYPSVEIARQTERGDWSPALARAADRIRALGS